MEDNTAREDGSLDEKEKREMIQSGVTTSRLEPKGEKQERPDKTTAVI